MIDPFNRRELTIIGNDGVSAKIAWFPGASDESIINLIESALSLPPGTNIIAKDPSDDSVVSINEFIPNGSVIHIEIKNSDTKKSLNKKLIDNDTNPGANHFRGELLKFERVQAHLANERTWLAWVRTALAALSISFSLLVLSEDSSSDWLAILLFIIGSLFIFNVLFTFITGWLRYTRVRDVLMLSKTQMTEDFHRFGLSHHAKFITVLLFIITFVYLFVGNDIET